MKLAFLTLAAIKAQGDEPKKEPNKKIYRDFGDGENFMSCTELFAGSSTFGTFQSEDGLRTRVII